MYSALLAVDFFAVMSEWLPLLGHEKGVPWSFLFLFVLHFSFDIGLVFVFALAETVAVVNSCWNFSSELRNTSVEVCVLAFLFVFHY